MTHNRRHASGVPRRRHRSREPTSKTKATRSRAFSGVQNSAVSATAEPLKCYRKKSRPQAAGGITRLGFEPRQREPKSLVLPLHYRVPTANQHTRSARISAPANHPGGRLLVCVTLDRRFAGAVRPAGPAGRASPASWETRVPPFRCPAASRPPRSPRGAPTARS